MLRFRVVSFTFGLNAQQETPPLRLRLRHLCGDGMRVWIRRQGGEGHPAGSACRGRAGAGALRRPPIRSPRSSPSPTATSRRASRNCRSATSKAPAREFDRSLDTLLESPGGARVDAAAARALRPAGRSDQRPRVERPGHGRRFHGNAQRPRIDRHPAGHRDVRQDAAPRHHGRDGAGRPRGHRARHSDSHQRPRAALRRVVPGAAPRVPHRRSLARRAVPPDDPERVPRRGAAAGPGVRAAHRERLQAVGAIAHAGARRVAVHEGHGPRERPQVRLVSRRARRPGEGHPGGGQIPEDALRHVRGLAPRDGVVQRRPGPREARAHAQPPDEFLDAQRQHQVPAARDARLRADDPGGGDHRQEPRAIRLRHRADHRASQRDHRGARPPSTCGAWPNGPACRWTTSSA